MSMEHWWNYTDRRKPKYWEKTLFQSHFVYHKSHTDIPGIQRERRWEAGDLKTNSNQNYI